MEYKKELTPQQKSFIIQVLGQLKFSIGQSAEIVMAESVIDVLKDTKEK